MRKVLSALVAMFVVSSMASVSFAAHHTENHIKVVVGGELLETDVKPIIVNGRTMLPLRAVFEAIGAKIDYIASERKVVAEKNGTIVSFVIDSNIMTINGIEKAIDVPAIIKNGRTLVPLRACAEAFNLDVTWNGDTKTARVKIPVSVPETEWLEGKTVYEYDANGYQISKQHGYGWEKALYDENGNLLYCESDSGDIKQYTYDKHGNLTSEHSYNKYEPANYDIEYGNAIYRTYEYEYDERGNCILFRNHAYGNYFVKYTYDSNNNLIYLEDNEGYWEKYTYDINGNLIYYEDKDGFFSKHTYDAYGKKLFSENKSGIYAVWEYDTNGNLTYYKRPSEEVDYLEERFQYDMNGNKIYAEEIYTAEGSQFGNKMKWEYDTSGNVTYFEKTSLGSYPSTEWEKYTYDEKGNLIYTEYSNRYSQGWKKYTYDESGNMLSKETSSGAKTTYKVVLK